MRDARPAAKARASAAGSFRCQRKSFSLDQAGFALDQQTSLWINGLPSRSTAAFRERVINLVNVYCPACMHVAMTVNQMIVNQI